MRFRYPILFINIFWRRSYSLQLTGTSIELLTRFWCSLSSWSSSGFSRNQSSSQDGETSSKGAFCNFYIYHIMETFDNKQSKHEKFIAQESQLPPEELRWKGFPQVWSKFFRKNLFVQSKHVMSFKISVSLHPATPAVLIVAITFLLPRWFSITIIYLWQVFGVYAQHHIPLSLFQQ